MNKAERKRRQNRARFKRWYDRQTALEAARKTAKAREWSLQRQKEQELWTAQEKARQEAEAARKAAEPKPPCVFGGGDCRQPSVDNPRRRQLCQEHYDLLYPPAVREDGSPVSEITREQVRQYNRRRTEAENPYIWKPPQPTYGTMAEAILAAPRTADIRYSEYTEATGLVEHRSRAELIAQVRKEQEAAANRTWTHADVMRLEADLRERMERRTDETTDY